jgi:hypothetical protein
VINYFFIIEYAAVNHLFETKIIGAKVGKNRDVEMCK